MSLDQVREQIGSLESYTVWSAAYQLQQETFNVPPFDIDPNDVNQLQAQMDYLSARTEQIVARHALMREIAVQDDGFLPLPYRLGALAAFKATDTPPNAKHLPDGVSISRGNSLIASIIENRAEQPMHSSSQPLARAAQIGDELLRITSLLEEEPPVPVAMVWNHVYNGPRQNYDEVALGFISKPKQSFSLTPPGITTVDGVARVTFEVPAQLRGVVKDRIVKKNEYVKPISRYEDPFIPTLIKLGVTPMMFDTPDALYIGRAEVEARIAKAEAAEQARLARIERRRDQRSTHRTRLV